MKSEKRCNNLKFRTESIMSTLVLKRCVVLQLFNYYYYYYY